MRTRSELARLLLDFARAPGRYTIRLGEPRALFRELRTIARWAQGRLSEELTIEEPALDKQELIQAAILFIGRACFHHDSTHYQVMGLTRGTFSNKRLRARYRALIRLTHPDIGISGLPANAAGMVNRAYEVLGDDTERRRYDEKLARQERRRFSSTHTGDHTGRHGSTRIPRGDLIRGIDAAPRLRERWTTRVANYPGQPRVLAIAGLSIMLVSLVAWVALDAVNGADSILVATQPTLTQDIKHMPAPVTATQPGAYAAAAPTLAEAAIAAPEMTKSSSVSDHWREAEVAPETPPLERELISIEPDVAALTVVSAATPVPNPLAAPAQTDELHPTQRTKLISKQPAKRSVAGRKSSTNATPTRLETTRDKVDISGARNYLRSLIEILQQPNDLEQLNSYLKRMNVKGSLLTPLTELEQHTSRLEVESIEWTEASRAGTFDIRSVLMMQSPIENSNILVFQLMAHFRATPQGTVLERLDLQPRH